METTTNLFPAITPDVARRYLIAARTQTNEVAAFIRARCKGHMNITETDVKNWLNSQRKAHGLPDWAHLSVSATKSGVEFAVYGHTPDLIWLNATASNIWEAVAKMQEASEPAAIIKRKREEAARLLAEAQKLEAKS